MFIENKCDQKEALALLGGLFCNIGKMVGVAFWSKNTEFTSNFGKTDLDTIIQNTSGNISAYKQKYGISEDALIQP